MKRGPLYEIAREYLERFPKQRRFGLAAAERQLAKVMVEGGWDAAELQWRIRQWSRTRREMTPWDLLKPLPRASPPVEVRQERTHPALPELPEGWREKALWIYDLWTEDLP